ncbi:hypothetical protein VTG60DRAFT_4093 [Thermothelomyces hinnuleus]
MDDPEELLASPGTGTTIKTASRSLEMAGPSVPGGPLPLLRSPLVSQRAGITVDSVLPSPCTSASDGRRLNHAPSPVSTVSPTHVTTPATNHPGRQQSPIPMFQIEPP